MVQAAVGAGPEGAAKPAGAEIQVVVAVEPIGEGDGLAEAIDGRLSVAAVHGYPRA